MSFSLLTAEGRDHHYGPPADAGRWPLLRFMLTRYGSAMAGVLVALVVASAAESLGLLALLPLLDIVTETGTDNPSRVARVITNFLGALNLPTTLFTVLSLIVLAVVFKSAFWLLAQRHIGYTAARIMTDLRQTMIRTILKAKWAYFTNQRTGIFANAVSTEADRASSTFMALSNLLAHSIQATLLLGSAFFVNWQISLAAIATGGVMFVLLRRYVAISGHYGQRITALLRSVLSRVTDGMTSIKSLKSMGQEQRLEQLLARDVGDLNISHRRLVMAKSALRAAQEVVIVFALAAGVYIAIRFLGWAFSELLLTVVLFQRAMVAMSQLQGDYQSMLNTESGLWAAMALVREAESFEETSGGKNPPALTKSINFDRVTFAYGEKLILNDVSLTIESGRVTAIIGTSGTGKTTLIDLVCRLLVPDAGRISVDGRPLDQVDPQKWRRQIGYVPQDTVLFHDTILRNVTLGDPAISPADAESCLRQSGAWDFIDALEQGIDTVVGEHGSRLSGGQRQRIAIARAIARQPRLLILDEATTSLDPETEAEICETLRTLAGEMTLLAVSHQPAIIKIADFVYRIADGRIVSAKTSLQSADERLFSRLHQPTPHFATT